MIGFELRLELKTDLRSHCEQICRRTSGFVKISDLFEYRVWPLKEFQLIHVLIRQVRNLVGLGR